MAFGIQGSATMTDIDQPTEMEIHRKALDRRIRTIYTATPGEIVSYDPATQTAEVQLIVREEIPNDDEEATEQDFETVPPLKDVPIQYPGGGGAFIHFELTQGDPVLVVFSREDFSAWRETGEISDPPDLRKHGMNAVAIPTFSRPGKLISNPESGFSLGYIAGLQAVFSAGGIKLGQAATEFIALAAKTDARFTAIETWLGTHAHSGGTLAGGLTGVAPGSPSGSSVASSKVKSE